MLEVKDDSAHLWEKMQRVWDIQATIYRTGGFYITDKRLNPVEEV